MRAWQVVARDLALQVKRAVAGDGVRAARRRRRGRESGAIAGAGLVGS
jgi:hypothetical protein